MNANLRLPILAALIAALLVAAPSSAGTVDGGPLGSAAKKRKPKPCKKKRGKKRKCKKEAGPEASKPPVASVLSGFTCPTGTVSGSVPATISGIATPPGEPVIIEYRHWTGTKFIDHKINPSNPDTDFYFDAVTPDPATGAWSFSFTPNRGPWDPANGTWTETVRVSYSGGAAASASQSCSWQVSA